MDFSEGIRVVHLNTDYFLVLCLKESTGVALYDTLAYGWPAIVYDTGSIREINDYNYRCVTVNKTPQAMAFAIEELESRSYPRTLVTT